VPLAPYVNNGVGWKAPTRRCPTIDGSLRIDGPMMPDLDRPTAKAAVRTDGGVPETALMVMSIHSATLPLRTFDLRQVCYEGALERCSLVVGRLRPDIVKVAEQPPSVTYIDDDGRKRRHVFNFRFTATEGKRLLAAVKPSALIAVSGIDRIVDTATGTNGWPLTSWSLIGPI
jgi:hypothetical protein